MQGMLDDKTLENFADRADRADRADQKDEKDNGLMKESIVNSNERFLLVASDIHDNENCLERLTIMANNPKCIAFLYAGDLNVENFFICNLLRYRNFTFIPVLGNCDNPWDWESSNVPQPPLYRTLQYSNKIGKFNIYMSHGHLYPFPSNVGLNDEDYEIYITGHSHKGSLETVVINNASKPDNREHNREREYEREHNREYNRENENNYNERSSIKKHVILLNPGSSSNPRGGTKPSYGIIRIPEEESVFVELRDFTNDALLSKVPIVLQKREERNN